MTTPENPFQSIEATRFKLKMSAERPKGSSNKSKDKSSGRHRARIKFIRGSQYGQEYIYNLNHPETQRLLNERRIEIVTDLGIVDEVPF